MLVRHVARAHMRCRTNNILSKLQTKHSIILQSQCSLCQYDIEVLACGLLGGRSPRTGVARALLPPVSTPKPHTRVSLG